MCSEFLHFEFKICMTEPEETMYLVSWMKCTLTKNKILRKKSKRKTVNPRKRKRSGCRRDEKNECCFQVQKKSGQTWLRSKLINPGNYFHCLNCWLLNCCNYIELLLLNCCKFMPAEILSIVNDEGDTASWRKNCCATTWKLSCSSYDSFNIHRIVWFTFCFRLHREKKESFDNAVFDAEEKHVIEWDSNQSGIGTARNERTIRNILRGACRMGRRSVSDSDVD